VTKRPCDSRMVESVLGVESDTPGFNPNSESLEVLLAQKLPACPSMGPSAPHGAARD
jgi:hypothetical protein